MNALRTPFDGQPLPASTPGSWSAGTADPPLPFLPPTGTVTGGVWSGLVTPWESTPLPSPAYPSISELPTL